MKSAKRVLIALLVVLLAGSSWAEDDKSVVTTPSTLTGLWWNPSEAGWGMSITQHGLTIFVAWYTYDAQGKPTWYSISSCPIVGNSCRGQIARVMGGQALASNWRGGVTVGAVGEAVITFKDNDSATVAFTLDGVPGTKNISRYVFGSGAFVGGSDKSDLWWNASESGWGVSITHLGATAFVAIFTYDANGNPTWYAVTGCAMLGTGCTGDLAAFTGGRSPTSPWTGANVSPARVGTASIGFVGEGAVFTAALDSPAATWRRDLTRDAFAGTGAPDIVNRDVAGAFSLLSSGGYRYRGMDVADNSISTTVGCGTWDFSDPRNAFTQGGAHITLDQYDRLCAASSTENACLNKVGNALILDGFSGSYHVLDAYMPGLLPGQFTHIELDTSFKNVVQISSMWTDPTVINGSTCSNSNQPTARPTAINGNWYGYRLNYNSAAGNGSTGLATMGCVNQVCTILSDASITVNLTGSPQWHTSSGLWMVGATVSLDEQLASAYLCPSPLTEAQALEKCTFYTFKRQD